MTIDNSQCPVEIELWKERLNSTGQPFHQYQQNEQPPLT